MKRVAVASGAGLLLVTACAVLCACTGSLFQSKVGPSSVYLLSAELAAEPAAALVAADIAVLRPRVRTGLGTDRIAVLYPDRRLEYFAGARWSGPLDDVVQDLAVQAFDSGARMRSVSADASAFPSGYWLELDVVDFQAEYSAASAPTVRVRFLARVGSAAERRVLATFEATAVQLAAENRLTAIVDAYQRAADAALADIVAHTVRTLGDSEHR